MSESNIPSHMSPKQVFDHALFCFNQGAFSDSLAIAERLIDAIPPNAVVFNLAASAARQLKLVPKAESYWQASLSAQPGYSHAHNNLGLLYRDLKRFDDAGSQFLLALESEPNNIDACVNMGNLCQMTEQLDKAEEYYRLALSFDPRQTDALYNLGLLLKKSGRLSEAEENLRLCLNIFPDQADVHNDLGNLLSETLRPAEAETAYREAIKLAPGFADAHFNLGILLLADFRYMDAYRAFEKAVQIQPDHASAWNNIGTLHRQSGHPDEAEAAYRRALEIRPDSANVLSNIGVLQLDTGRLTEAEHSFRQALELQPDFAYALAQAMVCTQKSLAWGRFNEDQSDILKAIENGAENIPALMVMSLPGAKPSHHLLAARQAVNLSACANQSTLPVLSNRSRGDRLRIGYISADFREHAVMVLLGGVLERHDRSKFEIHAYATAIGKPEDPYRRRAESACEYFHDVRAFSDTTIAEKIVADKIDILIDLTGHTQSSRPQVLALRPAPIIANWLGYPGTLGLPSLADYIIGDPIVTPVQHAGDFSEHIAQLPHSYLPNDLNREIGPRPSRAEEGLPEDKLVFCCFNAYHKLNPETFDNWCRILLSVPDSVLWLPTTTAQATSNLLREAEARSIPPNRFVFAEKRPTPEAHLGRLQLADIAIDTYPYTSHTTGCDALWAGVPLVTRMGDTFVSRVAGSLLHSAGLPELAAHTWDEFFAIATELARNADYRNALRNRLAANRLTCPLFDTVAFTQDLESLYEEMWRNYEDGEFSPALRTLD